MHAEHMLMAGVWELTPGDRMQTTPAPGELPNAGHEHMFRVHVTSISGDRMQAPPAPGELPDAGHQHMFRVRVNVTPS